VFAAIFVNVAQGACMKIGMLVGGGFLSLMAGLVHAQVTCTPNDYAWPGLSVGSEPSLIQLNMETDPTDPDGGVTCESIRVRAALRDPGLWPKPAELSNAFSWTPPPALPGSHQLHYRRLLVRPTEGLMHNPRPLLMEVYRQEFIEHRVGRSSLAVWVSSSGIQKNDPGLAELSLVTTLTTPYGTQKVSEVSLNDQPLAGCYSVRREFSACVYIETSPEGTAVISMGGNGDYHSMVIPHNNVSMIRIGNLGAPSGDSHTVDLGHIYWSDSR
jgi:hypothetical protein